MPKATVYSVTLAAGLHNDYALPSGFESGDVLMVQLLGDAAVDGIAAPASNNFIVRWVVWDVSGGLWRLEFRDGENSASASGNTIRTPGERSFEGPPLVLGPSEEEGVTFVYASNGSSSSWRALAHTSRAHVGKFDNTHSPVGRWDFDASLADASGNGFTLSGSPVYREVWPGLVGVVSGTLTRAHEALLSIGGDVTVQALCVMRAVPSVGNIALQVAGGVDSDEDNNIQWSMRFDSQDAATALHEGAGGSNFSFASTGTDRGLPALGVPFYFAERRQNNVYTFWLNGVQWGSASATLSAPTGGANTTLEVRSGTNPPELCALKICASALTAAEIRAEYNRTLGGAFGFV